MALKLTIDTTGQLEFDNREPLSIFMPRLEIMKTNGEKLNFANSLQELFTAGNIGKMISYDFRSSKQKDRCVGFIDIKLYKTKNAKQFRDGINKSPNQVIMNGIKLHKYLPKTKRDIKKTTDKSKMNTYTNTYNSVEYNFEIVEKKVGNTVVMVPLCNKIHKKDWTPEMERAYFEWIEDVQLEDEDEWDKKNEITFGNCVEEEEEEEDNRIIKELCDFLASIRD